MNSIKKHILIDWLILLAISLFFVLATWGKWTHPITDFGREAYIPWAINQGDLLYKDLAYLFGAFPPLWNAFWFKLFGASLLTIRCVDMLVILGYAVCVYRFFYCALSRSSALSATLCFLILFAFGYLGFLSNMYYLSPFTHSYFYAIFFAFCSLNVIQEFMMTKRQYWLFLLGALLGLALLSRLEIFLIIFFSILISTTVFAGKQETSFAIWLKNLGRIFVGIGVVYAPFLFYVASYLDFKEAFWATIGYQPNWADIGSIYLYKNLAGFIDLQLNIYSLFLSIFGYAVFFLAFIALGHGLSSWRNSSKRFIAFGMLVFFLGAYAMAIYVVSSALVMFVFMGAGILVVLFAWGSFTKAWCSQDENQRGKALCLGAFCLFSLGMLFKVPIRLKLINYGMVYGMPATILTVACVMHYLPQYIEQRFCLGRLSRSILFILFVVLFVNVYVGSLTWLSQRNFCIVSGKNEMWSTEKPLPYGLGGDVLNFLQWVKAHTQEKDTMVVFPEGVMLNFLSQRKIPGKHVTYMHAEMAAFGEESILKDFMKSPPDYFILVKKDTSMYGPTIIGKNYGVKITQWVLTNYHQVWKTGGNGSFPFLIVVFKKNAIHEQ